MPVVTPFGELQLGDPVALERWLDAHNRRHMLIAKRFKLTGGPLNGPVDGDWMLRHAARHVTLATLTKELGSANTKVLAMPGVWKTEQQLWDWHALHNRLHTHIDRVGGIYGR